MDWLNKDNNNWKDFCFVEVPDPCYCCKDIGFVNGKTCKCCNGSKRTRMIESDHVVDVKALRDILVDAMI